MDVNAAAIIDGVYVESVEKNAEIIKDEALNLEKKVKQMLYLNTLDYVLENNIEDIEINLHRLLFHIINRFKVINPNIVWDLSIDEALIIANVDKIQVLLLTKQIPSDTASPMVNASILNSLY